MVDPTHTHTTTCGFIEQHGVLILIHTQMTSCPIVHCEASGWFAEFFFQDLGNWRQGVLFHNLIIALVFVKDDMV